MADEAGFDGSLDNEIRAAIQSTLLEGAKRSYALGVETVAEAITARLSAAIPQIVTAVVEELGAMTDEQLQAVMESKPVSSREPLPLDAPVEALDLNVRAYNALKQAYFVTIADVLAAFEDDFLSIRHFGLLVTRAAAATPALASTTGTPSSVRVSARPISKTAAINCCGVTEQACPPSLLPRPYPWGGFKLAYICLVGAFASRAFIKALMRSAKILFILTGFEVAGGVSIYSNHSCFFERLLIHVSLLRK